MSFVYTVAQLKDLSVLVDLQSRLFLEEASIAKALDINEALYKKAARAVRRMEERKKRKNHVYRRGQALPKNGDRDSTAKLCGGKQQKAWV